VNVPKERIDEFARGFLSLRNIYYGNIEADEQEAPARIAASFEEIAKKLTSFANSVEKSRQFQGLKTVLAEAPMGVRQEAFATPARVAVGKPKKPQRPPAYSLADYLTPQQAEMVQAAAENSDYRVLTPSRVAPIDEATISQLPERLRGAAEIALANAKPYEEKIKARRPKLPGWRRKKLADDLQRLAIHYGSWAALTPEAKETWLRKTLKVCGVRVPVDHSFEPIALLGAQLHHVLLDRNLLPRHESPPSLLSRRQRFRKPPHFQGRGRLVGSPPLSPVAKSAQRPL
jgi:hypothetical protein